MKRWIWIITVVLVIAYLSDIAFAVRVHTKGRFVWLGPRLVSPIEGTEVYTFRITFRFITRALDEVESASGYLIYLADNSEFVNHESFNIADRSSEGITMAFSTYIPEHMRPSPGDRKTYYWKVKVVDQKHESYWSEVGTFRLNLSAPPPPVPASPASETIAVSSDHPTVTFSWHSPPPEGTQSGFRLQIADNPSFSPIQVGMIEEGESRCATMNSYNLNIYYPLASGRYWWRIRTKRGDSIWSEWSSLRSFCLCHEISLTSPRDGKTFIVEPGTQSLTVLLDWSGDERTRRFFYFIEKSSPPARRAPARIEGITWKHEPVQEDIPIDEWGEGEYLWGFREMLEGEGGCPYVECPYATRKFYVYHRPETPAIIYPTDGSRISEMRPTFEWERVLYATSYLVQLQEASSGSLIFSKEVGNPIFVGVRTITLSLPEDLAPGRYVFKVRSIREFSRGFGGPSHGQIRSSWAESSFEIRQRNALLGRLPKPQAKEEVLQKPKALSGVTPGIKLILPKKDNAPPSLSVLSPKDGERIKSKVIPAKLTVNVEAKDQGEVISGIDRVEFWRNGKKAAVKTRPLKGSRYVAEIKGLKEGWNKIEVKAYDRAGNRSSISLRVYIECLLKKPRIFSVPKIQLSPTKKNPRPESIGQ
ncbi:MAG: hypothetical protein DRG83_11080 [Deltaproteobacteria bacterium]|nr:MAG: hypothetical protein DRG83_11080 [Deltaproteobacteria bacterium]